MLGTFEIIGVPRMTGMRVMRGKPRMTGIF